MPKPNFLGAHLCCTKLFHMPSITIRSKTTSNILQPYDIFKGLLNVYDTKKGTLKKGVY